jgi:hypothetical protein
LNKEYKTAFLEGQIGYIEGLIARLKINQKNLLEELEATK